MFDVPGSDIIEVVVDKKSVDGDASPKYVTKDSIMTEEKEECTNRVGQ